MAGIMAALPGGEWQPSGAPGDRPAGRLTVLRAEAMMGRRERRAAARSAAEPQQAAGMSRAGGAGAAEPAALVADVWLPTAAEAAGDGAWGRLVPAADATTDTAALARAANYLTTQLGANSRGAG